MAVASIWGRLRAFATAQTSRRTMRSCVAIVAVIASTLIPGAGDALAVEGSASEPAATTYPWMGHLRWREQVRFHADPAFHCGATLLSPNWALTAQHCVNGENSKDFKITFNANDADGDGGWESGVTDIVLHPGFIEAPLINDLALLRLEKAAPPEVAPVRLALSQEERSYLHVGTQAMIMGWGRWAEGASGYLRTGSMQVNMVNPILVGARPVNRAYGTWTGKGDSGGPILIDTGKGLVQVGVVSGTAQDDEQQSSFNRVDPASSHWRWISSTTGIASVDEVPPPGPLSMGYGASDTRSGNGYWAVTPEGEVTASGDAKLFGSMADQPLNAPIVAIAGTPTDAGYWLVAADGGVFAFGDAQFYGSMGGKPLNAPVVAVEATHTGGGYWLAATDGGVFAFGDARFFGSLGSNPPTSPVLAMGATPTGAGYSLTAADGQLFYFGDAAG